MANPVFVVLGCGPGIGLATASLFASKNYSTIALVSRNADRLATDKQAVLAAAKRDVRVEMFQANLCSFDQLSVKAGGLRVGLVRTFKEIEQLGPLGMVFFNAARIKPSKVLATDVQEIEEDFRTTNLALYVTAQWAIPLLQSAAKDAKPSFFVTNSALPEQPIPQVLSLSAVKASQQNIVQSLNATFGQEIHFGIIKVKGPVTPEEPNLNPTNIARRIGELYDQPEGKWTLMVDIDP